MEKRGSRDEQTGLDEKQEAEEVATKDKTLAGFQLAGVSPMDTTENGAEMAGSEKSVFVLASDFSHSYLGSLIWHS